MRLLMISYSLVLTLIRLLSGQATPAIMLSASPSDYKYPAKFSHQSILIHPYSIIKHTNHITKPIKIIRKDHCLFPNPSLDLPIAFLACQMMLLLYISLCPIPLCLSLREAASLNFPFRWKGVPARSHKW